MPREYNFVAIGDTVTDAFIRLKNPAAHVDIDRGSREICMRFADKIPYEDVIIVPAVGNPANAAASAARLGLKSALVTNLGEDYFGEECFQALKRENIATEFIQINHNKKTNYHYVLWYEDDRTILIKHEKYDYKLPDINDPGWIYFSSLAEHSLPFHEVIEKYLAVRPKIKLAFQPNTFQIKFGAKNLAGIYKRTDLFISNKEEAERILEIGENKRDIKELLDGIALLGPKIVVITDGPKGAYALGEGEYWFMPPYPDPKPPYERTGAGDAFSSTFTAALALGKTIPEALSWAPINSMSVVQYVGAREGLLSREKLEKYLEEAPADYKPKKI
ncbi:carbohydrate kinase family protein [Candidatus Giovannonibacteria bacterium]|nr:carbohydrate kinase family protein [Candidatus Giovannonibacteria bacterium]